jgi:hypothetical protein
MILQLWAGLVPCWTLTATGSPGWLGLGLQWDILWDMIREKEPTF